MKKLVTNTNPRKYHSNGIGFHEQMAECFKFDLNDLLKRGWPDGLGDQVGDHSPSKRKQGEAWESSPFFSYSLMNTRLYAHGISCTPRAFG